MNLELDWHQITFNLYHMAAAYVLALPVAWNREKESRSAGLRTFPLVSVAACGYMLTGLGVLEDDDARGRIIYGIITGIGFIGGGAIVKNKDEVGGTATAASIWCTGSIGIAVAWGRYEIALLLAFIVYATFQVKSISLGKKGTIDD